MVSVAFTQYPPAQFATLSGLRRRLDHAFNDGALPDRNCTAPADVVETSDELQLLLEVPGLRGEDLELTVENGILTVSGEKNPSSGATDASATIVRLAERRYGRFTRQFRLPRTADASGIRASCEDGLLTIRVPRAEASRARRIEVRGEAPAAQKSHHVAGAEGAGA